MTDVPPTIPEDVMNVMEINAILDIVHKTRELPNLSAINGAAMLMLVHANGHVQEWIDEQQKAAAEAAAEKAAEDKRKADEEAKKAEAKAKEKEMVDA